MQDSKGTENNREKSFFIMPHSHIDVEWYWTKSVTGPWSNNILHKALSLLEEAQNFVLHKTRLFCLNGFGMT